MSGTGTAIASTFLLGPQIAAQVLGLPFQHYRPGTNVGLAPVEVWNRLPDLPAWITADDKLMGSKAFAYAKPVGYAALDPTQTRAGDYLVGSLVPGGPVETFFIASQDVPEPIQVVRCNRVASIARPSSGEPGPKYYGGNRSSFGDLLLTEWPCSLLQGTKGEKSTDNLPGDTRSPWMTVLLPVTLGVTIRTADVMIDDLDSRYIISSVELTVLGWRLTAAYAGT